MDTFFSWILSIFVIITVAALMAFVSWYRMTERALPFNSYTTSAEAMNSIDLSGKVAIITGSNKGIGKQTAATMYEHGCTIIMACRSLTRAEKARSDIIERTGASSGEIKLLRLDLSSLQSVRDFAAAFVKMSHSIDYLILNAGIMGVHEFTMSTEGYELQWAVNHLGHQYLTQLLLPKLIENQARVIVLASVTHGWCTESQYEQFLVHGHKNKDGPSKEKYQKWVNYGLSKSSNILFAREMHRRYGEQGVIAVSAHPGYIGATGLNDEVVCDVATAKAVVKHMASPFFIINEFKNIDQGAATALRCVSMDKSEIKGGHYYVNCRSGTDEGCLKEAATVRVHEDYERDSKENRLWTLTEKLITQKNFSLQL